MGIEGHIGIELHWDGARIVSAAVAAQRPQVAARLLVGQPVAAAVSRVPLVFSICGRAQAAAAAAAVHALDGGPPVAARGVLGVLAESLHESCWRILCDWPALLGEAADTRAMATLRRALQPVMTGGDGLSAAGGIVTSLLAENVLGEDPQDWLAAIENDGLGAACRWWARSGTGAARLLAGMPESFHAAADADPSAGQPPCRALPSLAAAELAARLGPALAEPGFAAQPLFAGEPAETGPLARCRPLLVAAGTGCGPRLRLVARLVDCVRRAVELANAAGSEERTAVEWAKSADGSGWGVVDTARGTLIHVARIDEGRVTDYRIVAPTEWNFHPRGPLPAILRGARADSVAAAERLAAIAVQALDPCVAHRVEVKNA